MQPALQRDVPSTGFDGARGGFLSTVSDVASGGVRGQNTTGFPSGSTNRSFFIAVTRGGVAGASSGLVTRFANSSRAASTRRIRISRRFGTSTLSKAVSALSASSTRARSTRTRSIWSRVDMTNGRQTRDFSLHVIHGQLNCGSGDSGLLTVLITGYNEGRARLDGTTRRREMANSSEAVRPWERGGDWRVRRGW